MRLVERACAIAQRAHAGQLDKGGKPYIEHPMRLADAFHDDRLKAVAYLHDVVEDTGITLETLEKEGFPKDVLVALEAITKRPEEDYFSYLMRVKANPTALLVKLADLKHNMDMSRIASPTANDYARLQRYEQAYRFLKWMP